MKIFRGLWRLAKRHLQRHLIGKGETPQKRIQILITTSNNLGSLSERKLGPREPVPGMSTQDVKLEPKSARVRSKMVFLVDYNRNFYALKVVAKKYEKLIRAEKTILWEIQNFPYCVCLKKYLKDKQNAYFLMEYLPKGCLADLLRRAGKLPENVVAFFIAETSEAVYKLHQHGIIHRDIKLQNVGLTNLGHIRLFDFGLAEKVTWNTLTKLVGTPSYFSPEVIRGRPYTYSSDIWALGVMTYRMLTGCNNCHKELYKCILKSEPHYPADMSIEAQDFCQGILKKEPDYRLGCGPNGQQDFQGCGFFRTINWDEISVGKAQTPDWVNVFLSCQTNNKLL